MITPRDRLPLSGCDTLVLSPSQTSTRHKPEMSSPSALPKERTSNPIARYLTQAVVLGVIAYLSARYVRVRVSLTKSL